MTESFNRKLGRLAQNVSGTGSITANASTASAWQTARTITLGGDLSGSVSLDGSSNVSLTATVSGDSIVLGTDTTGNYVATVTAGSGITVSGSGTETASVTVSIDNTVATLTGSQTLTNKTISGADNTLSNIGNASLTNSSITINGTSTSLGGTRTLVTDDIAEDASPTNLWYTDARTRAAISVTDAGGDGSLSYVSGTGVITYTGPSATEVRAHFSAGTGVTITTGQVAIGQAVATTDNVTFAGVTVDNIRVGVTAVNEIDTSTGNLVLDSTGGTITLDDNATVTGNLQVDGNLTVSGTTVTINATNLAVEDNMIYLNNGSAVTNPDLGIAGNYNDGTYRHAGVFRDATDGVFKFFHQYTPEPDASAFIDTAHASFALAPIQASTFTGNVTGDVTGNASTATTWQTARTLTLTGDVTGTSASFNGSGNISISTTIAADSVALGTDTTGNYVASITNGNYITGGNGGSEGAALTLAVDATSANTASKVVARDASGNFSAGTITATLSGNASTVTNGVYTTDTGTVTNTMLAGSIANNKLANSTISGVALGSNLGTLTLGVSGTGLSGSQTYNGSGAATFTVTSNATSANTGSTIVARDASGNFSAGTITATLSGNASTATSATSAGTLSNNASITGLNFSGTFALVGSGASTGNSTGTRFSENYGVLWNMADSATWHHQVINGSMLCGFQANGTNWGSGKVVASSDMRATIFYDYNNTGYYTDPASTSNFNALQTYSYQGNGNVGGTGAASWHPSGIYSGGTQWLYGDIYRNGAATYGGGAAYYSVLYDGNDSAYYIDSNSTSRIYNLTLAGAKHTYLNIAPANGYEAMVYYEGGSGSPWYVGKRTSSQVVGTESFHFYSVAASRTLAGVDTSGNMMSDGSMRSPVFYDYNDTGYYIDPNSTSNSALRVRGGALFGPNTSWSAYLYVGTNGRPDSNASVCATNGNLHIDCQNGYAMYLNYYSTNNIYTWGNMGIGSDSASYRLHVHGTGYATSDFRAPIFYDSNDTGYYTDPNSSSQMSSVYANNWFRAQNDTGFYFQTYGYGSWSAHSGGNSYGNVTTYGGGRNGWTGWGIGSRHVFMSTTGDNVGVHDNSRGWIWYWNGSYTEFPYGYTIHGGSSRSPIFYDQNDTGYYCDPASTSYMYRTIFQGRMLFYGADQSADGTNDAQIYFTPGGGLTIASITTTFETGFVGSSYPNNRQAGAQATYDKRFYVWQDLVQYYSDERLKEKTGTLAGALDAIKSWTPFKYVDNALANSFNFGSDKPQIGLSAQEVQQFYPELVELAPFDVQNDFSDETNPRRVSKSGENYLTLNYTRLVPVLVQAIKEQQAKIEELERRINNS